MSEGKQKQHHQQQDIQIPLKPLLEEFVCPICFDLIRDAYMTPCGHNFCRQCIDECLNVKHECPVCHHNPLTPEILVKNRSLDNVLAIASAQKEKALNNNFQAIIQSSCTGDLPKLSPLQEIFQARMRVCINAYENYYASLLAQRDAKLKKAAQRLEDGWSKKEHDAKVEKIGQKFEASVRLLLEGYDKMLKEVLPTPSFVPMSVRLVLAERSVVFPKVVVSPIDHMQDVLRCFEKQMKLQGMVLVSWGDDIVLSFKNPLSLPPQGAGSASPSSSSSSSSSLIVVEKKDKPPVEKGSEDNDDDNDDDNGSKGVEVIIDDPLRPMHLYGLMAGATVYLRGHFVLQSDLADKTCFVERYSKDSPEPEHVDYFTCKTCGVNWVCNVCARECHAGHDVSIYIKGHVPTWACCYCWKKCKCCKFNPRRKAKK